MQLGVNRLVHERASIVLLHRWDPVLAASLIEGYRVNVARIVPVIVGDLLSAPVRRHMISPAFAVFQVVVRPCRPHFQEASNLCGVTFLQGYGLTEVGCQSHVNPPQRIKTVSVGIPIQSVESIVVAPDTLARQPVNEAGEILIRGANLFKGYWNNPAAKVE